MKNFEKDIYTKTEQRYLALIFFLFGISIMSLAPRTPDLKANLEINNGTFGTLLGSSSIGSIMMLLIGGQIVHRIGAKRSLQLGSTGIATSFITLVHTNSPVIFLAVNIMAGASISIYHIASSGHSLHRQDEVGSVIVPKLHGVWAVGAMCTAAIAFLISDQISIGWHITSLMVVVWSLTQISIMKLSITFSNKKEFEDEYQGISISLFKFKINWFLSLGFFCASIMEFTIADWATLFGKEVLKMSPSISTLCYLVYLMGLIIGRFSISWALNYQSEKFWIRCGGVVGGCGFISMVLLSNFMINQNKTLAFTLAFIGFLLAGLGSSALAPIFFSIAGRLSNGKNAIAVAQLSFVNTCIIFISKIILAWIVQLTSITLALIFAALMMFALLHFGKIGSPVRTGRL